MKKLILMLSIVSSVYAGQKPIAVFSFEPDEEIKYTLQNGAEISRDANLVPAGKGCVVWHGGDSAGQWNEFFRSDPTQIPLEANATYTISFKYKIIEKLAEKGSLYFLAKSIKSSKATGWTTIQTGSGASGVKTVTFTLEDYSDYVLIFGHQFPGKVVLDDITISKGTVSAEKETMVPLASEKDIHIDFESLFMPISISLSSNCRITGLFCPPLGKESVSGRNDLDFEGVRLTEGVYKGNTAQRVIIHGSQHLFYPAQFGMPVPLQDNTFTLVSLALRAPASMLISVMLRQNVSPRKIYWEQQIAVSPEWRQFDFVIPPQAGDPAAVLMIIPQEGILDIDEISIKYRGEENFLVSTEPLQGNLLPASSFPAGLTGYWNFGFWPAQGRAVGMPDPAEPGPTGVPSLKIGIGGESPYEPMKTELFSPAFIANKGKVHTFSFYAKAATAGQTLTLMLGGPGPYIYKNISIVTEWKRYSVTEKLPYNPVEYYCVRLFTSQPEPLWIDGLMLEESDRMNEFMRAAKVELGLRNTRSYGLFTEGEPLAFSLSACGDIAEETTVRGVLIDASKKSFPLTPVVLSAGKYTSRDIVFTPAGETPFGSYRISLRAFDKSGKAVSQFAELLVHRVHTPRMATRDAPDSPFGIHINAVDRQMKMVKTLGFNWVRCHDGSGEVTKWFFLEKEQGIFDFSDADAKVDLFRKNNLMILGTLDTSPRFYSACPADFPKGFDEKQFLFKPEHDDKWRNYCKTMTSRYRGKIDHWEVWNEPYAGSFFRKTATKVDNKWFYTNGTYDDYVPILVSAYSAAKEGNPACGVLWANNVRNWNEGCMRLRAYEHCDKWSFHYYNMPTSVGFPDDALTRGRADMATSIAGTGRTIGAWNTEGGPGYALQNAFVHTPPLGQEEMIASLANYLVRYYVSMLVNDTEKFFLYSYHTWGTWTPTWNVLAVDGSLPPSAAAMSSMMWQLEGTKYMKSIEFAPGWWVNLFSGDGRGVAVIIGTGVGNTTRTFATLPKESRATDLYGNPVQFPYTLDARSVLYISKEGASADLENVIANLR